MLHCKTSSLKGSIILVFVLPAIITFLVAYHLFVSRKYGGETSMLSSNAGQVLFTTVEMRHIIDGGHLKPPEPDTDENSWKHMRL